MNIDKYGIVWICGMGNDMINWFDFELEMLVEFCLLMCVSYIWEIEFDDEGNVWISIFGFVRYMECGVGVVIWIFFL